METAAVEGTRPLVVVTGAAGHVGTLATQALAGRYRLRLIDLRWPAGEPRDEDEGTERLALDLSNRGAWDQALESAHAVVHLAGHPYPGIDVRTAVESGAMLTAHLAAAAVNSDLKRIVFASSIHTMGLYHRHGQYPIRQEWSPRPCCEYGAGKVFSENLLELLSERTSISVVCLRLGLTGFPPGTTDLASQWLGPADYSRLLHAALTVPLRFRSYFGMSAGATERWDLSETIRDLGFNPTDPIPDVDPPSTTEPGPASEHCLMFNPHPAPDRHAED